jgi:5-methylcytosine-specific restriction endonuclease McrA
MLKKRKRPWNTAKPRSDKTGWTKEGNSFYQSKTWKNLRAAKIAQIPYCEYCKEEDDRIVPAEVVDHVRPIRLYPELAAESNNLKSSCKQHHYRKTAKSKVNSREQFEAILKKI